MADGTVCTECFDILVSDAARAAAAVADLLLGTKAITSRAWRAGMPYFPYKLLAAMRV